MTDRERLQRMRWIATGLLITMVFLYALMRTLEESAPVWGWVRAFAEAAMVGALADWFAVTALFRHPLGLPIPHTAIVRNEQKRIGASLARFVRGSFLTKEEISRQWQEWKPIERFAKKLSCEDYANVVVRRAAGWLPVLLENANAEEFSSAAAARLREGLRSFPVGRLAGVLLGGFLRSPSRRNVLAPLLGKLSDAVSKNREWVMEEARKGAPMRGAKLLGAVTEVVSMVMSGKAVAKLSDELKAASQDQNHVLFEKIEEAIGETLSELENGGGGEWEAFKLRVLDDPETQAVLKEVIRGAGRYILAEARGLESGQGGTPWGEVLSRAAARLLDDREQLGALEKQVEEAVASFIERYSGGVEALITKTVASWEADDLIERLENQVGPDLQFIRINGTIIGGTVGVLLHAFENLIW